MSGNMPLLLRTTVLLTSGISLFVVAAVGLYLFSFAEWFTFPGPYAQNEWEGYGVRDFIGLTLFTFLTTVSINLFVLGIQGLSAWLGERGAGAFVATVMPTAVLSSLLATLAGVSIAWGEEILRCGVINCNYDVIEPEVKYARPEAILGWKGGLGVCTLIAALSLAVSRIMSVMMSFFDNRRRGYSAGAPSRTTITLSPAPFYWSCCVIIPILSFFYFYLSGTIPNNWEYHSAPRLAAFIADYLEPTPEMNWGSRYPELPDAWFRTVNWRWAKNVVVKVFPANLFFYVFIAQLGITATVIHQIQWSRKLMQRRVTLFGSYSHGFTYGDVLLTLNVTAIVTLFFMYWAQSHNYVGYWYPGVPDDEKVRPSEHWARALGQLAVIFLSLLLFPASRNSIFHHPFGTHWESLLWTHRVLGTLMLLATIGHMIAWYVRFDEVGLFPSDIIKVPMTLPTCVDNWTVPLITLTTWFMLLAIGIGALPPVRRRFFEAFYYLHLIAAYTTIPAVLWHAAASWEYMLPGLTVWFIDRVIRFFRSGAPATVLDVTVFANNNNTNSTSGGEKSSDADSGRDVVEIRFRPAKGMNVFPGQYVFLNIPQISILEWHPYTISTTGTNTDYLTVHLKGMGVGTWSDRVIQHCRHVQQQMAPSAAPSAANNLSTNGAVNGVEKKDVERAMSDFRNVAAIDHDALNKLIQLNVDGPYGSPLYYNDYDQVVLIAGGIGITPCASILSGLRAAQNAIPANAMGSVREDQGASNNINYNIRDSRQALLTGGGKGAGGKQQRCRVRRVVLKWSVRCMAEVDALSSALACSEADLPMGMGGYGSSAGGGGGNTGRNSDGGLEQRCTIHATRGLFLDPPAGFDVQQGRPNYEHLLRNELCINGFEPQNTLVFVCGPEAMMTDAIRAATAVGCHVHNEVFEL